jgi:hypothetical protein
MMSIAKIMGAGSATNKRKKNDFYETPEWVTEQLCVVEREHLPSVVWEPSSGKGAITRVLQRHGIQVIETDLVSRVGQQELDFLKTTQALASAIITNPPFKIARQYILQAHKLGVPYLVLLLKLDFHATKQRQKLFAEVGHPTRVWALADRPDFLGQGAPTMNCGWVVWDGWHAPHSILQAMPLGLPGRPLDQCKRGRRTRVEKPDEVSPVAVRTAARLLCQYPNIDLADRDLVVSRCLEFKADVNGAYDDVKRAVRQLRAEAAAVGGTSWTPDDLRQQAQKLFDEQRGLEEQPLEFYAAQARYKILKVIRADG